jgi:cytochrome d ubiquinol oxidase subunit I
MDNSVNAARALMADSLGFHIIFAMLGVGLPLVISLIELWSIRRKDEHLREAARRLSMVSLILVVAGVASGTIIAIQMSLMWSGLVDFGGPVIGLPFMLEGYAFLLEAIFLAVYVTSWKKLSGYKHWLLGLPVILGAFLSAFFITSVNAWMQQPGGFDLVDGKIANPHVWEGILTKTTLFMTSHSILGYYAATFLVVLGGYAWYVRRKNISAADRKTAHFIMIRLALLAVVTGAVIGGTGHFYNQFLARTQPRKFAAIELVPKTTSHAPYVIGGELSPDGQSLKGGVRIPNLLSVLTGNSPNTEVKGLNEFPRAEWPLLVINKLFEAKMALVGLMLAIPAVFAALYLKWRQKAFSRPVLWALVASGPIAIIVIELGWMVAEFGRQPFAVNGLLRTEDAFTKNPGVVQWGYVFPTLYIILFAVTVVALRMLFKRWNSKGTGK